MMMDNLDNKSEKLSPPKKWVPRPLVRVCGVCGSPATDVQHYGATACYSCRAFFRRTIGSGKDYKYCSRKTDACVVDAVTRTNCKKCRFQNCLQVGMKPEKVDHVRCKNKIKAEFKEELREESKGDSQKKLVLLRESRRSASESSQDSKNSLDISALAEECIIEEVKYESKLISNILPSPNHDTKISFDMTSNEKSDIIESQFTFILDISDPTIHLTFEEDFKIHELLVRKEKLVDGFFQTFMELPDFQKCFEQHLHFIKSGEKLIFNGIRDKLVVLIRNYVVPNFMNGGIIRQSLEMFDGYKNVVESVKTETFFFSISVMYLCVRAILKANRNKKTFVNQHLASGLFTNSIHKACSSLFPNNMDLIGSFDPLNISQFASPWAAKYEDEEFFVRTLDHVGSIILDDVKLGSLYCNLVLATPGPNLSKSAQSDPSLQKVQREMTILIFRYLSHKSGDTLYADRITSALTKLLADLHICREIHLFGRLAGPWDEEIDI